MHFYCFFILFGAAYPCVAASGADILLPEPLELADSGQRISFVSPVPFIPYPYPEGYPVSEEALYGPWLKYHMQKYDFFFVARVRIHPPENLEEYPKQYPEVFARVSVLEEYEFRYIYRATVLNLYYKGEDITFEESDEILLSGAVLYNSAKKQFVPLYEASEYILWGCPLGERAKVVGGDMPTPVSYWLNVTRD